MHLNVIYLLPAYVFNVYIVSPVICIFITCSMGNCAWKYTYCTYRIYLLMETYRWKAMTIKVKVNIYSPDVTDSSADLSFPQVTPGIGIHSITVSSHWGECSEFAADANDTVSCFIPPGTHYCWVARDIVNSNLTLKIYTWPVCRETNPRPIALRSNTLPLSHALHSLDQSVSQSLQLLVSMIYMRKTACGYCYSPIGLALTPALIMVYSCNINEIIGCYHSALRWLNMNL
jgi:hypothetical protein